MPQKSDLELADNIIKRISREKLAQPGGTWHADTWKKVWRSAIIDEIERARKGSKSALEDQAKSLYEAYPRKVARQRALVAIRKALSLKPYDYLLEKVEAYAKAVERWSLGYRYSGSGGSDIVPHPASWFNGGYYDDDQAEWLGDAKGSAPRKEKPKEQVPSDWVDIFMRRFEAEKWRPGQDRVVRLSDGRTYRWVDLPADVREELRMKGGLQ